MFLGLEGNLYEVDVQTTPTFNAGFPRALFKVPPNAVSGTRMSDFRRFLASVTVGGAASKGIAVELNWTSTLEQLNKQ